MSEDPVFAGAPTRQCCVSSLARQDYGQVRSRNEAGYTKARSRSENCHRCAIRSLTTANDVQIGRGKTRQRKPGRLEVIDDSRFQAKSFAQLMGVNQP